MQEEQTFYPVTTEYFTACLPLLEKYFGITAGYFNKELSNAKCLIPHREGNIVKYSIKEDCNYGHEIEMYTVEQGEKRDKRQ